MPRFVVCGKQGGSHRTGACGLPDGHNGGCGRWLYECDELIEDLNTLTARDKKIYAQTKELSEKVEELAKGLTAENEKLHAENKRLHELWVDSNNEWKALFEEVKHARR